MSRCNVYGKVSSSSGREIGIGGRGAQDWLRVTFNTDNALHSDCALRVFAEVEGEGLRSAERRRKDGDKRMSVFAVHLPEQETGWKLELKGQHLENVILPDGRRLSEALK